MWAASYPPPDHFTRIPLLSSRVFLRQGVPYHPAQERRGVGKVWWKGDGAGAMWVCGCVESGRGGEAVGGLHRILHPNHFTRILLLSSRVLLHQGVPYHPAQERRGAGEVRWKGDDASGMWVCGCMGRVWEMRMRRASPRSGAFKFERSKREERREEPGRLLHVWCDLSRITPPPLRWTCPVCGMV